MRALQCLEQYACCVTCANEPDRLWCLDCIHRELTVTKLLTEGDKEGPEKKQPGKAGRRQQNVAAGWPGPSDAPAAPLHNL